MVTVRQRAQRLCVWCCVAGLVLFFIGLLLADLLPPLSPDSSAEEIKRHWLSHTDVKRAGLLLITFGGAMIAPFLALISAKMKQVEGSLAPFAYTQLLCSTLLVVAFTLPAYLMGVEAFRPERSADEIRLLNDAAWILFVGWFPPFFVQCCAIAVACFLDDDESVFPRWLGYVNVWVALVFVPAGLILFFKTGPFAWNGVLPFYLALVDISVWFVTMWWALLRSIRLGSG